MKNEQYIMALDQGTTSSRCILFDHQGNRVSTASQEFSQHYPKPGWVEHDPMEIFASQLGVASRAMNQIGIGPSEIKEKLRLSGIKRLENRSIRRLYGSAAARRNASMRSRRPRQGRTAQRVPD